ncbi:DUF2953 domain-containing protein [Lentibacillus saliphilus]|uniref:DUF2953 domain-containing protein n=1 Tax=Lentibacillus saliphilus TaxID=2737028 RepID=UPI001C30C45D|nr:DUF2953 domain-containing protein [Lentibacillus saliphilus]
MIWIVSICLGALVVIFLASRLYIDIKGVYSTEQHDIVIKAYFYKVCLYKKTIIMTNDQHVDLEQLLTAWLNTPQLKNSSRISIGKINIMKRSFIDILQRVRFKKWDWYTQFGLREADVTGFAVGGIWAIKYMIVGYMSQFAQFSKHPHIAVVPQYDRTYLSTQLNCMFSMTMGQIMYSVYLLLRRSSTHTQ